MGITHVMPSTGKSPLNQPGAGVAYVGPRLMKHRVSFWMNIGVIVLDNILVEGPMLALSWVEPYSNPIAAGVSRFPDVLGGAVLVSAVIVFIGTLRFVARWLEVRNVRDLLSTCGVFWPLWRLVCVAGLLFLLGLAFVWTPGFPWMMAVLACILAYAFGAWRGYALVIKLFD